MNHGISRLWSIAQKPHRFIIGLMSGTSLDGLDIALCKISGFGVGTVVEVLEFESIPYSPKIKAEISSIFAKETVDFAQMTLLHAWIGKLHAQMVNDFLDKRHIGKSTIDLIASHGQTVMHVPQHQHKKAEYGNATLQIGDGDHIAFDTGIITISDFRQKHVAAGGEGAPLAVYGDYLMFSKVGEDRILLNLGGIGNYTYLSSDHDPAKVFVTDTGPGNTLMDTWMKVKLHRDCDLDANVALQGTVQDKLLDCMMKHPFFSIKTPKTTGPELFNYSYIEQALEQSDMEHLSISDIMATLNMLTARSVAESIAHLQINKNALRVFVSGGGAHNPLLMQNLKQLLAPSDIADFSTLGMQGDAKEAVLFAVLANERVAGEPLSMGSLNKIPAVCMGKISFPD